MLWLEYAYPPTEGQDLESEAVSGTVERAEAGGTQGKMASWAWVYSIWVHPAARANSLLLLFFGILATHSGSQARN